MSKEKEKVLEMKIGDDNVQNSDELRGKEGMN